MDLPPQSPAVAPQPSFGAQPERIEILAAFANLPDVRKASGKRHHTALCLALFTLAVTAGKRGFLAIDDWLKCYRRDLIALFNPPKSRLPSYSTIRRVLLKLDYEQYSAASAQFFGIGPLAGETLAVDGKVLRRYCQIWCMASS
ncbi:transposase family protein [Nodosilinea sp. AN01ver1]|uniref:transposase family protein n=1 Tax=Nodosilinea sp. AN01ver1 TaxID=3423362 RepID=UPI003D31B672